MLRKTLTAVLILGWVSLSVFDLLEDLRVPSQDSARDQNGRAYPPNSGQLSDHANNMVESALDAHSVDNPLARPENSQPAIHPLSSLNRALSLHKLHHVFLI